MKLRDKDGEVVLDTEINSIEDLSSDIELDEESLFFVTNHNKSKSIEKHIYTNYPAKKQSQDEKWVSSYTTKLKASGVEDLELKIVNKAKAFFKGDTLEKVLKDVADDKKPYFKKLIKVAIRTEWAELCVMEGVKAIQEDREPNYPPFPNI